MTSDAAQVLVTGGLGFIGCRVVERLCRRGFRTVAVDNGWSNGVQLRASDRAELHRRRQILAGLVDEGFRAPEIIDADLLQLDTLRKLLERIRPTHVVHLAGLSRADLSLADASRALAPNLILTHQLLDALCGPLRPHRFLFASSSMVYGHFESATASETHPCRPIEPYGASKLACEVLVEAWGRRTGAETTIVRPSAVYGPGDFNRRVPQLFLEAALAGEPMIVQGDGSRRLDFSYVDDVAEGIVLALLQPEGAGQCFNLTHGESRSVGELAATIQRLVPGARIEYQPEPPGRPRRGTLDIAKARKLLGFKPMVGLEEGLRRMLAMARSASSLAMQMIAPRSG